MIYDSITDLVGRTPMVKLNKIAKKHNLKANILAKCECYNPLFSVKDRIALSMIEDLEKKGKINENTILLEATSGNTGIALAAICAAKGYNLVIAMPENMTEERIKLMEHFGAEVILTPAEDGMSGAIKKIKLLAARHENAIIIDQFNNPANPDAHRFGTAMEIMEDTQGEVDAIVAGVGTSGTLTGVVSALKTTNPDLYVVAVEPKSSPVLEGGEAGPHKISGIGAGFVPKFYDPKLVDEIMAIEDQEAIFAAIEIAKAEGLPVGISAGAAVSAATKLAKRREFKDKNIVVILPDLIERYLSTGYF